MGATPLPRSPCLCSSACEIRPLMCLPSLHLSQKWFVVRSASCAFRTQRTGCRRSNQRMSLQTSRHSLAACTNSTIVRIMLNARNLSETHLSACLMDNAQDMDFRMKSLLPRHRDLFPPLSSFLLLLVLALPYYTSSRLAMARINSSL